MARSREGESIKTFCPPTAAPLLLLLLIPSFGCRAGKPSLPRGQELILDIPRLEAAFRRYWTKPADWRQAPRAWFTPDGDPRITGGLFTNTINQASSEFRDRHMVKVLSEAALRGARVLAVVGRNHVPMQTPALECLLKRDLE